MTTTYYCWDDSCGDRVAIEAETAEDAAQEYVDGGEWGEEDHTRWVTVSVEDEAGTVETHRIALEPTEPDCAEGESHDWQSPLSVVGGIAENPGVWGHGGGVILREVCAHCGIYRSTDTWATDSADGTQGLRSVRYEDADERSSAWVHATAG